MSGTLANQTRKFLTTGQFAELCGVSFRTVIRWIQKGYLRANRLPGRGDHRIEASECVRFMREHEMTIPEELTGAPQSILIVDNELAVARAIQRVLRREGYETHIATDGFQAGVLLASVSPSLVTLDLKMSEMDGLAFLDHVRSSFHFSRTKILVVSGAEKSLIDQALEKGANSVLEKPFSNEELVAVVSELIRPGKHSQRERRVSNE